MALHDGGGGGVGCVRLQGNGGLLMLTACGMRTGAGLQLLCFLLDG